jgi:hypothetical protein
MFICLLDSAAQVVVPMPSWCSLIAAEFTNTIHDLSAERLVALNEP